MTKGCNSVVGNYHTDTATYSNSLLHYFSLFRALRTKQWHWCLNKREKIHFISFFGKHGQNFLDMDYLWAYGWIRGPISRNTSKMMFLSDQTLTVYLYTYFFKKKCYNTIFIFKSIIPSFRIPPVFVFSNLF